MKIPDWYFDESYYTLYFISKNKDGREEVRYETYTVDITQAKYFADKLKKTNNNNIHDILYMPSCDKPPYYPTGRCVKLGFGDLLHFINVELFWVCKTEKGYITDENYKDNVTDLMIHAKKIYLEDLNNYNEVSTWYFGRYNQSIHGKCAIQPIIQKYEVDLQFE